MQVCGPWSASCPLLVAAHPKAGSRLVHHSHHHTHPQAAHYLPALPPGERGIASLHAAAAADQERFSPVSMLPALVYRPAPAPPRVLSACAPQVHGHGEAHSNGSSSVSSSRIEATSHQSLTSNLGDSIGARQPAAPCAAPAPRRPHAAPGPPPLEPAPLRRAAPAELSGGSKAQSTAHARQLASENRTLRRELRSSSVTVDKLCGEVSRPPARRQSDGCRPSRPPPPSCRYCTLPRASGAAP
jgi:hypothetical protein